MHSVKEMPGDGSVFYTCILILLKLNDHMNVQYVLVTIFLLISIKIF